MKVTVTTYPDAETDDPESERVIDLRSASDREWLRRHTFWALNQGKCIEAVPDDTD